MIFKIVIRKNRPFFITTFVARTSTDYIIWSCVWLSRVKLYSNDFISQKKGMYEIVNVEYYIHHWNGCRDYYYVIMNTFNGRNILLSLSYILLHYIFSAENWIYFPWSWLDLRNEPRSIIVTSFYWWWNYDPQAVGSYVKYKTIYEKDLMPLEKTKRTDIDTKDGLWEYLVNVSHFQINTKYNALLAFNVKV
jgi:hypothetical protein